MFKKLLKSKKTLKQQRGQGSERLAADYLRSQGYFIIQTNVRYKLGELDIIAREAGTLCFVEVRSTGSDAWGGPLATITEKKKHRIIRAASTYLAQLDKQPLFTRFDVIGILWTDPTHPQIELIRDAFGTNY